MARFHEYQGKALLEKAGIGVPRGTVADSAAAAGEAAESLRGAVVVKAQAWTTGRYKQGLIHFADDPAAAAAHAAELLRREVGGFPVDTLLVEEKLDVAEEYFASIIISDREAAPVLVFSATGGSGVEEIARDHPDRMARHVIDVREGLRPFQARDLVRRTGIRGKAQGALADILVRLWTVMRDVEARSAEINPIVCTADGRFLAADCRITVDDYAVFRHPGLGIAIARELNHPPTPLEKIAWEVEKNDYRGTFYFLQMATGFTPDDRFVGFHGAGGGGSMMGMDALQSHGYPVANFCDTSGNPAASKVYRAARIILSQPGIVGYFGSGSGVASQEQYHSARGLVKAFREAGLSIPAVIRLGGNGEDRAVRILTDYTRDLPAPVEGYRKDDSVEFCVERFDALVRAGHPGVSSPPGPPPAEPVDPYTFESPTGRVTFDHAACLDCASKACIETCVPGILSLEEGRPVLNITREEARRGKCIECLACEVECHAHGNGGGRIFLPIPGLDQPEGKDHGHTD